MIEQKRALIQKRVQKALRRGSTRRRIIRYSLIAANVAVLAVVVTFVVASSHGSRHLAAIVTTDDKTAGPVDGLTAYDIAANMARVTNLPESTAISNQAQSAQVAAVANVSDTSVIAKPQIVTTALKSREDIRTYTVASGDTVTSIAQKFDVTSDSIKWSNGITSDSVTAGTKLTIPPVNGIVYTVKAGDTVQNLASKYKANADQIVAYNDAEIAGIATGEQILIPNGQIQQTSSGVSSSSSSGALRILMTVYAGNGYDYGYCTWYAYNERVAMGLPVGSNWGNAVTWAAYASAAGYRVDHTPEVGAIQQNGGGLGHVAIVTVVNADGSYVISEMNATAGWGRVDTRTMSASAAGSYNFIH